MVKKIILIMAVVLSVSVYTAPEFLQGAQNALTNTNANVDEFFNIHKDKINIEKGQIYSERLTGIYYQNNETQEFEFYQKRMPEEFLVTFMYFTRNRKDLRPVIYAIMKHESANFSAYINTKNDNKTIDYGVMMLNSSNIQNPAFMQRFAPLDTIQAMGIDVNTELGLNKYYMATCINFFIYLVEKHEIRGHVDPIKEALKNYNGGERNVYYGIKKTRVERYARVVKRIKTKTINEYNNSVLTLASI